MSSINKMNVGGVDYDICSEEFDQINSDLTELTGKVTTNTTNINTLNSRVDAHTFGSSVNLASYTSTSNKYTFPKDGYLRLHCTSTGSYVIVELNVTMLVIARASSCDYVVVPVKKGMNAYIYNSSGSFLAYYYPLN